MNGFTKAQMGIIAMLTVMLVSITRRLPERRFSSGITTRLMLAGIVLLAVCSAPVYAACCGIPLTTKINGTVDGGVYVGGGHGSDAPNDPVVNYSQDFNVPAGDIEWARLYVKTGSHDASGWTNISFYNGTGYANLNKFMTPADDCSGNTDQDGCYIGGGMGGTYWRYWNVTDIVETGYNNATVQWRWTSGGSGGVTGVVLVAVYNNGGAPITYWINEGFIYLGTSDIYSACAMERSTTWFNGTMDTTYNATLWTVYFVGQPYPEDDILEFNGHRFDVCDTADGSGNTSDSSWGPDKRFDVDKWEIPSDWIDAASNDLTYIRGNDTATRAGLAVFMSEKPGPDLTVSAFDTLVDLPDGQTPTEFVTNHNYAINVTVRNAGNMGADPFNVTFEVGAQKDTTNLVTGLGAGLENVSTYYWTPTISGNYVLNATADADGDVDEGLYEFNNATTESVTVLAEGNADLEIVPDDITFYSTYTSHTANNNTLVRVAVRNNGTGDAGDGTSTVFKVQVVNSTDYVLNETTTWLRAKCCRTMEFEVTLPKGQNDVTVKLDPDGNITESNTGNNDAVKNVDIVMCRVRTTHTYGNDSIYNGPHSNYIDVEMFNVVKLAPKGTDPVELLKSVANSTEEHAGRIISVDGIREGQNHSTMWCPFINGIRVPNEDWYTYPLHDNDTVHWDFLTYINSPTGQTGLPSFNTRPVMDYPEPFIHGYDGVISNVTIVYPDELCYPDKADAIKNGLIAAGVPPERINTTTVSDLLPDEKENNNLILLGTPSNNPLIADINSQRYDVGLPVYFNGSYMTDDSDDTSYVGGVVEACDNPYDGSANFRDTVPIVWLAAAVEDYWAYKAADMLASDTGRLDRFRINREQWLNVAWDGADVTLDWSNWHSTCTSDFNIHITNDLTAGFQTTPDDTTSDTSWKDTNAGSNDQRYYKVTCSATDEQIEGNVTRIKYELEFDGSGVNWISMPSVNPPITNADELISSIPNMQNGNNVKWWNSTSQQAEVRTKFGSGGMGPNFLVRPGSGYEISIGTDTTWVVVGLVPPICPIKLNVPSSGVSWVGMPFNTAIDDADELINSIPNMHNGNNVKWWNSTSQQAEVRTKFGSGGMGPNFLVRPSSGYEISIGTDTTWIPS